MESLQDKLEKFDHEIYTLHQFCVKQGFNPHQIQTSAQPLISMINEDRKKRWLSLGVKLAILVALLAMLFYYDPAYRFIYAGGRLAFIKVLPYWDWTELHGQECIIDNPYYLGTKLEEEDCELCESLNIIPRLKNISHGMVSENYLKQDRPFIVTDATTDWEASSKFNVHFLNQLYHNEESLSHPLPCMFLTNIRLPADSAKAILRKAASGDVQNYYAHWENCDKIAAKSLRQFYTRPYFIPPMVQMAEPNWIFIAHTYTGKKSKPADLALPMMWVAQLKGEMKVILQPKEPCKEKCPTLYATLHQGEMLVTTDLMWLFDYIPYNEGEMVALGGGGYFD